MALLEKQGAPRARAITCFPAFLRQNLTQPTAALSGYSEAGGGNNLEVRAVDDGGANSAFILSDVMVVMLLQSAYRCCDTSQKLRSGARCNRGLVPARENRWHYRVICLAMLRELSKHTAVAAGQDINV